MVTYKRALSGQHPERDCHKRQFVSGATRHEPLYYISFKEYIDAQKFFDREYIEVVTEMVTSKELKEYIQTNKDNKGDDLDMCKAITDLIEDGREEGKIEGKIETLADLVNDGDMTVEKAASKMQITVEEFIEQAEALGFKLASN